MGIYSNYLKPKISLSKYIADTNTESTNITNTRTIKLLVVVFFATWFRIFLKKFTEQGWMSPVLFGHGFPNPLSSRDILYVWSPVVKSQVPHDPLQSLITL